MLLKQHCPFLFYPPPFEPNRPDCLWKCQLVLPHRFLMNTFSDYMLSQGQERKVSVFVSVNCWLSSLAQQHVQDYLSLYPPLPPGHINGLHGYLLQWGWLLQPHFWSNSFSSFLFLLSNCCDKFTHWLLFLVLKFPWNWWGGVLI